MRTRTMPNPPSQPRALAEPKDIVVIGGGMAGAMAALAAKQPGNSVLLVEPGNVLGGQGSAGGVAGFCGDTKRVNDEFAQLVARLAQHGLIDPWRPNSDRRAYDLEWCAFFLQEMLVARGIEILLHARLIGARSREGVVREVDISTAGGGLMTLAPRFVIDASGACVTPLLAGFPVMHEGANRQLPMSLYFTLWDTGEKVTPVLPGGCPRWTNDNEIPMTSLHVFPTGKVEVKMKVVGFDAADGASLSQAEIFARRQMHALIYYLQTTGYRGRKLDTHVLASVSRGIGIREQRRIVGEHVLTEAEARRGAIFTDAVAVNTYHIDYHWPDRAERAGTGITDMLEPHHLPLRMMIPKGARNMLVPGRGASAEQMAMSAFRVMAVVAQMGFAAGHAARQCLEDGVDLRGIDVPRLQAAIEAGGQSLDLSMYGEYLRRDLFAAECAARGATDVRATAIARTRNGCFVAAWCAPDGVWLVRRQEKHWSNPYHVVVTENGGAKPRRLRFYHDTAADGGTRALLKLELLALEKSGWSRAAQVVLHDEAADCAATEYFETPAGNDARNTAAFPAFAELDDGTLARAHVESGPDVDGLIVSLSRDGGATWAHGRAIDESPGAKSAPSIAATRTGMGLAYAADGGRLMFWHGSVERIIDGPPAAQAHAGQHT